MTSPGGGAFGPGGGPSWGGGPQKTFYTVEGGEIVLAHEGELEIEPHGSESLPFEIPVVGYEGQIVLRIHPEYFRMIMHSPEVTAQVDQRCEEITDVANSLAVKEGAEYYYFVSNNPANIRARGRVKPANEAAKIDDDINSTLLKALASVGSDPLPPQYFTDDEAYQRYLSGHEEYHSSLAGDSEARVEPEAAPEGTDEGNYMGGWIGASGESYGEI